MSKRRKLVKEVPQKILCRIKSQNVPQKILRKCRRKSMCMAFFFLIFRGPCLNWLITNRFLKKRIAVNLAHSLYFLVRNRQKMPRKNRLKICFFATFPFHFSVRNIPVKCDTCYLTYDMWPKTCDKWHVTHDTRHVKHDFC